MKKLILLSLFALSLTPAYAKKRAPITVTTVINATAQEVWDVLIDFKNYGQWNQWNVKLEGEAKIGSKLKAYTEVDGKSLKLKITKMEAPYNLCWVDVTWFTKFGLGGWRSRMIRPNPNGNGVILINHFEYTGIFGGILDRYTREFLELGLEQENRNLRDFIEDKN